MMEGNGDLLPVSALLDGAFPTGTAKWASLAAEIPIWDPSIIDCGKCAMVCPHSTIA